MLAHGNAVDAVVAGLLVAAAAEPTVLLGPVQLLAAGAGAGLLAIDGRVRQPGIGIPRPRGALSGAVIPPTARVGVPAFPAAVATAVAALGKATLLTIAGPAVEQARPLSGERAAVLERFARQGAKAFSGTYCRR